MSSALYIIFTLFTILIIYYLYYFFIILIIYYFTLFCNCNSSTHNCNIEHIIITLHHIIVALQHISVALQHMIYCGSPWFTRYWYVQQEKGHYSCWSSCCEWLYLGWCSLSLCIPDIMWSLSILHCILYSFAIRKFNHT